MRNGDRGRAIRPLMLAMTVSSALVVPFAAGAHAPLARGHDASHASLKNAATDPGSPAVHRVLPRIRGQVGPGMTISVSPSRVVKGRYRIVVDDDSSAHNWHISGPGDLDRKTSVNGTGRTVWRVRLRPGTYTVVCDTHPSTMSTSLRVTAD